MSKPRFCVIVLSYNRSVWTARAVDSVLKILDPSQLKDVYLVHNGTTQSECKKLMRDFNQINHLQSDLNLGFSGGANFALKKVFQNDYSWALFLTNDCQIESLPDLGGEGVIVPLIISTKKKSQELVDSLGGGFYPKKAMLRHFKSLDEISFYQKKGWRFYVPGTAFAIHKTVFDNCGGFDQNLGTYWEDVDLSMRWQRCLINIKVDPKWRVGHAIGKTCHKDPLYTLYYFQRNKKKVSFRYCSVLEKPVCSLYLGYNWLTLVLKLIRRQRFGDIKWLVKALVD